MRVNRLFYLNLVIGLVIALGFFVNLFIHRQSDRQIFERNLYEVSGLASESLYAWIDPVLREPVNVSMTMASDVLLKEKLSKENDTDDYVKDIRSYLAVYKEKYNYGTVFLVPTKSKKYFYEGGVSRVVADDMTENWYYDLLSSSDECSFATDKDTVHNNEIFLYTNCKIFDKNHSVIGVIGVGISRSYIREIIKTYAQQFNVSAFLLGAQGEVEIASAENLYAVNLFKQPPLHQYGEAIAHLRASESRSVLTITEHLDGINFLYSVRYLPYIDWYLVSVNDSSSLQEEFHHKILVSVAVALLTILIVIATIIKIVSAYNRRITGLLTKDPVSGVRNRISYEENLEYCEKNISTKAHFGIGVIDLNGLKTVNDVFGHEAGDRYITESAKIICAAFPNCPVFRIGGDEFAILLDGIAEEHVQSSRDTMQTMVTQFNHDHDLQIGLAFGYDYYVSGRDKTLTDVFERADAKMYVNKQAMKAEASVPPISSTC